MENSLVVNPLAELASLRSKSYDSILDAIGMMPLVYLRKIKEEVGQRREMSNKRIFPPPRNTHQQRYLTIYLKGIDASLS